MFGTTSLPVRRMDCDVLCEAQQNRIRTRNTRHQNVYFIRFLFYLTIASFFSFIIRWGRAGSSLTGGGVVTPVEEIPEIDPVVRRRQILLHGVYKTVSAKLPLCCYHRPIVLSSHHDVSYLCITTNSNSNLPTRPKTVAVHLVLTEEEEKTSPVDLQLRPTWTATHRSHSVVSA